MKFTGGRVPYGFVAIGEELAFDHGRYGWVLVTILKLHRFGDSCRRISQALNVQNIPGPAGGEWNYGSVARVIKRGKELSHLIPFEYAI